MIQCSLEDAARYYGIHPNLKRLFDFVRQHDLLHEPQGRITIDDDKLFVNVSDCQLVGHQEQKLEVHRRYIDVHLPLDGSEIVGWRPLESLGSSEAPFDEEKDFALYAEMAQVYTNVIPGQCLIIFPEDAHAPLIGHGMLKKAVAKILI